LEERESFIFLLKKIDVSITGEVVNKE
jgi:hypothetical protein